MVAAISATPSRNNSKIPPDEASHHNPSRPPLLPSEKDNGVAPLPRKPKTREITSRYLSSSSSSNSSSSSSYSSSSSSSRRCPSPLVSRGATLPEPSIPKRAQSVERRRPVTPRPTTPQPDLKHGNAGQEMSTAAKVLWTSTRSLSVSFQGESFSLPVSKVKAVPPQTPNLSRKATPERRVTPGRGRVDGGGREHQVENSRPIDQHRWPARARQSNPLTRSLDCSSEKKPGGPLSGSVVRALQQSMIDEGRRVSYESRLRPDWGNADAAKTSQMGREADLNNGSRVHCDSTTSDTESVSSGSNSGIQEPIGVARARATPRGISVPARFWQETNSRLRRLQDPSSPLSTTGSRTTAPSKVIASKKALLDSPLASPRTVMNSRALSSPLRGPPVRHPSPSKLMVSSTSSPARGMSSPSRTRNSLVGSATNQPSNAPSMLTFVADVRRGKMGENRIEDAHMLRLLYNRHLQWRFVNARADAAMSMQRLTAEKNLYNAWETTSELRGSVTIKRSQLQLLRQKLKLSTILRGQTSYLEEWSLLERDHSSSLSEAIEALKASTLRLPVTGGARADIQKVKDAVGSAVDVMQAMGSSICSLLSKVEGVNSLATELASVAAQERSLLDQCRNLLSTVSAMQVEEYSLRTHLLQLQRVPNLTQL